MATLQEQQSAIDAEIVSAMIVSMPEEWKVIRLLLEREPGKTSVGEFLHEL